MNVLRSILIACAFMALAAPARPADEGPIVMKIGTATVNDQQVQWMKFFKQSVEERTHGRIRVDLYPSSQLGSTPREIEDTQFGAIQGWVGAAEFLSGVDPRYQLLSVPGLFTSPANAQRALHDPGVYNLYAHLTESKGLIGIGLFFGDADALVMRKPVRAPGDIEDAKVRVLAGAIELQYMRDLGASGIPMPLDQVNPALQQGTIDGVLEGITTAAPFKQYTLAKYLVEMNEIYYCDISVISKTWFDALPGDLKNAVLAGGRDADREILAWDVHNRAQQFGAWTEGGGEVVRFSTAQRTELNASLANLADTVFAGKTDLLTTYHLLQSAAERSR